jgi:purine-nucleoside phosphorylase
MSTHIAAKKDRIAPRVLMPGDPLRAKYIAENFLENTVCYNEIRGMYGFTGTYKDVPVSVQGSGMGMPSMDIYLNELIREYGVRKIIRIGTCGAMSEKLKCRDIVLAVSASTDSAINRRRLPGDFAVCADFDLLIKAYEAAKAGNIPCVGGPVLSTDTFYGPDPDEWKVWAKYGVLAVEMECSALYALGLRYGVQALGILSVSDHLVTRDQISADEREKTLNEMITLALETVTRKTH